LHHALKEELLLEEEELSDHAYVCSAAKRLAFAAGASLLLAANAASGKGLKSIGVSVGSVELPFFASIAKGAEFEARTINPDVKITTVEHFWDPPTQSAQIDAFIAAGVDLIVLNPSAPNAIEPAIGRAHEARIPVVAADSRAAGADVTVETNNMQAGRIACEYLIEKMDGKGAMVILFGAWTTSMTDRAKGCNEVAAKHPEVRILAQSELTFASRDGGFFLGSSLLRQFSQVDGAFAGNAVWGWRTQPGKRTA
jgi:ribose transport system substrate-binding protein